MRVLTLLLGLMLALPIVALGQEVGECDGPYKGRSPTDEELKKKLEEHEVWLGDTSIEQPKNSSDPRRANLCGAKLKYVDLSDAILIDANLSGADLTKADLSGASLVGTNLSGADLSFADLTGADLTIANLVDAKLIDTNLSGVILLGTDLSGAMYEPGTGKQPSINYIALANGLSALTYLYPRALINLRKLFKDGGYRIQERRVNYAINHVANDRLLHGDEGRLNQLDGVFKYVFFELTTKWGMSPGRALSTIAVLVLVFSFAYVIALRSPTKDGIWRIWSNERVRDDLGSNKPELLSETGFSSIKLALYFSLLSAFHIGWRDLNVGNWITRVQPREYTLRASGWVRTVSGIQSLLSVYLLAMWALTYFGRPFG